MQETRPVCTKIINIDLNKMGIIEIVHCICWCGVVVLGKCLDIMGYTLAHNWGNNSPLNGQGWSGLAWISLVRPSC